MDQKPLNPYLCLSRVVSYIFLAKTSAEIDCRFAYILGPSSASFRGIASDYSLLPTPFRSGEFNLSSRNKDLFNRSLVGYASTTVFASVRSKVQQGHMPDVFVCENWESRYYFVTPQTSYLTSIHYAINVPNSTKIMKFRKYT